MGIVKCPRHFINSLLFLFEYRLLVLHRVTNSQKLEIEPYALYGIRTFSNHFYPKYEPKTRFSRKNFGFQKLLITERRELNRKELNRETPKALRFSAKQ